MSNSENELVLKLAVEGVLVEIFGPKIDGQPGTFSTRSRGMSLSMFGLDENKSSSQQHQNYANRPDKEITAGLNAVDANGER